MDKIDPKVILTKDGSPTLLDPIHHSSYHSIHGAVQESRHVFIDAGLSHILTDYAKNQITIFEMGFGTGLNALLSLEHISQIKNVSIHYTSIELHPLSKACWTQLDYSAAGAVKYFEAIHSAPWHQHISISPNFILEKKQIDIIELSPDHSKVDLIYYDAFGPGTQPALWTSETLMKIVDLLVPGGIFVTYCAKGEVRRILSSLGLRMERLPGPPGKREMLRGTKNPW